MSESRFSIARSPLRAATPLAAAAGLLMGINVGAAQAQTVDFSAVSLTAVSTAAGQTFAAGAGGTVNVRLLSGQVDTLIPGSGPDATGFYALQSNTSSPEVFRFTLSLPQSFVITQNETVTNLENNKFTLPSGAWTILSSSNETATNSGSTVAFQGVNANPPYGTYQIQGTGPSFDFTVTDSPGISQYGSAISLKLNGVSSAAAPEPGSLALIGAGIMPLVGLIARRRRAAGIAARRAA